MKFFILLSVLLTNFAHADFIDNYAGKKANCEIGYMSPELLKPFPYPVDFKLVKIALKFDDPKARDYYRDQGYKVEDLFIITYEVRASMGTFSNHFTMNRNETHVSFTERGDEVLTYKSDKKSVMLITRQGWVLDKYEFHKNGTRYFTCSSLHLFE